MLAHPGMALAQAWDRLADGRVVIVVKGHKFIFPAEGYDAGNVRFNDASLQDRATLPEVIASPERARAIFEQRANVSISTGVGRDKSPFLGMYDRESVQSLRFSFNVGENQSGCQGWAVEFDKLPAAQGAVSDSGLWREYPGGSATIYKYIGHKLSDIRPSLQNLVCNKLSYCSSSLCLAPDLGFSFSFWRKEFPQERWLELLRKIDAILTQVTELHAN
jgi:hypothetical protein